MLERVGYGGELDLVGLSEELWRGIDIRDYQVRPNAGYAEFEHFMSPNLTLTGKSVTTQATAGTFAMIDGDGGQARVAAGSTTANQGANVQMQSASTGLRFLVPALGRMVFEARVKFSTISTFGRFFVGLAPINTAVVAAAALTTGTQYAGFHALSNTTLGFTTRKSSSTTSNANALHTIVDGSWVKLGMIIENASRIRLYVNGVQMDVITSNVHDGYCIPTFLCHSGGTVSPTLDIDWYMLAQQNLVQ